MNKKLFSINILDRYVIKKYFVSFFYTLLIITIIVVVLDLSENIDDFIKSHAGWYRVVTEYYAGYVPFYINFSFPLINFVAVIYFTSRMANNYEIISIYSTGASHWRVLKPFFITALCLTGLSFVFNNYIIPYTNSLKYKFDTEIMNPTTQNTKSNIHMRLSGDTYAYFDAYNPQNKTAYRIVLYKMDKLELREKMEIYSMQWNEEKKSWTMKDVKAKEFLTDKKIKEKYTTKMDTILDLDPEDLEGTIYLYSSMSNATLKEKIKKEKIRGTGGLTYLLLERYKRLVFPASAIILMIIGFSVSSKKKRGGLGLSLGIGIILSFIYVLFVQFADVFALKGGYPPLISVLIPNFVFSLIAFYTFLKIQK